MQSSGDRGSSAIGGLFSAMRTRIPPSPLHGTDHLCDKFNYFSSVSHSGDQRHTLSASTPLLLLSQNIYC